MRLLGLLDASCLKMPHEAPDFWPPLPKWCSMIRTASLLVSHRLLGFSSFIETALFHVAFANYLKTICRPTIPTRQFQAEKLQGINGSSHVKLVDKIDVI
jgi:hypothetical protein